MSDEFDLFSWERLVMASQLPATTKLVAFVLRTHADPDGTRVKPGLPRLAVLTGLSYETVKRARQELVRAGLLALHKRGNRRRGHGDEYRLIIAEDLLERLQWRTPSEIDAAAAEISTRRAEAEQTRRAKKHQGSADSPETTDQGSESSPENPDQGPETGPENNDQGSPQTSETAIRGHQRPTSGLASDPLPDQVTTPPNRPAPTHLPTQPSTAREKCRHGIPIGARGDGTLACAFCRREAKQSIVEAS
ncbi:helix-turn-helix domain-containing protein [Amycolatopsis taiwanensis]|uniref:helix-turn-helix domain-containing protein n=1 Tax=Amycolatopsis taiwanensis TaxID=342230 RepID=UPI0004B2BC77|nr:helix-turn-helix domain-containing protein [Amycolatopsis taiwanensis]